MWSGSHDHHTTIAYAMLSLFLHTSNDNACMWHYTLCFLLSSKSHKFHRVWRQSSASQQFCSVWKEENARGMFAYGLLLSPCPSFFLLRRFFFFTVNPHAKLLRMRFFLFLSVSSIWMVLFAQCSMRTHTIDSLMPYCTRTINKTQFFSVYSIFTIASTCNRA